MFQNGLSVVVKGEEQFWSSTMILEGLWNTVSSVSFSPDGKHIVAGSHDRGIQIWDAQTGELVARPFKGHQDSFTSVSFSPDGKHIVSGSLDRTIRIWDAQTGELVAGPFADHQDSVTSVTFSFDGKHFVSSGLYDETIQIWDTLTGELVAKPFAGHQHTLTSVTFSPDQKHISSYLCHQVTQGQQLHTSLGSSSSLIKSLRVCHPSSLLLIYLP